MKEDPKTRQERLLAELREKLLGADPDIAPAIDALLAADQASAGKVLVWVASRVEQVFDAEALR